jgi:hypothetical protein
MPIMGWMEGMASDTLPISGPIRAIVPDGDIVRRAVDVHAQYGVHFYDGMIVAGSGAVVNGSGRRT